MKLSVITATYNAEKDLPHLMESLRAQTFQAFEWVVADGGSTDGTMKLLEESGLAVSSVSEKDFGIYDALNKALRRATGDYYLVVGADDRLFPEALKRYADSAAETQADLIIAGVEIAGRKRMPIKRGLGWRHDIWAMIASHSVGCLIRRSLHEKHGYYSKRFPICADSDFFHKVYAAGGRFEWLDSVAGSFSTEGTSGRDALGVITESMRIRLENGYSLAGELALMLFRIIRASGRLARAGGKRVRLW